MKKFFTKIKNAFKKPLKTNKQKVIYILILLSTYVITSLIMAYFLHWLCLIPLACVLGLVFYVVFLDTEENIKIRAAQEKINKTFDLFKQGGDLD